MRDDEFVQVMREAGYDSTAYSSSIWKYSKLPDCFCLEENKKKDSVTLYLGIYVRDEPYLLYNFKHEFKHVSELNSIDFKKKIEDLTEYAYSLYMDVNRHIDALQKKMTTRAGRLGI